MSLFPRTRTVPTETRGVRIPAYVYSGVPNLAGVAVTPQSAMASPVVWACVRLLAETGSMLPVDVVRYGSDGSRTSVSPAPQIVARPSLMVPSSGWRYQAISSWLTDGNVYARVTETTGDMKYITRAEILDPGSVSWNASDGLLRPHINGKPESLWPIGDLWHIPAYLIPGSPVGMSPIEYAAESIGLNLAARKFGAQFFGDGAHPTAILTTDTDPGESGAKSLKEKLNAAIRGSREPIVLPADVKYQQIQVNPTDSQFIDTQRFSGEDICRFFGVPSEMVGVASSGSSVTYANAEQRDLSFLKYGLDPWLTRIEEMLTGQIPRPQVVRINRAALLRTDTMTRYLAHEIALRNGFRSINEVRELEDEEPIEGGDFGGDTTDDPAGDTTDPGGAQ